MGFPGGSFVKNPPANAGDIRDTGSIPGSGRSPGGGHDNPLQLFLPGEPHGQRSLVGYSPQGHKESDMTKVTEHAHMEKNINFSLPIELSVMSSELPGTHSSTLV